jgi:hypothetical protein
LDEFRRGAFDMLGWITRILGFCLLNGFRILCWLVINIGKLLLWGFKWGMIFLIGLTALLSRLGKEPPRRW